MRTTLPGFPDGFIQEVILGYDVADLSEQVERKLTNDLSVHTLHWQLHFT